MEQNLPTTSLELLEKQLPPPSPSVWTAWEKQVSLRKESIAVLDDDPTGTQTVYGVPVLTSWAMGELSVMLEEKCPIFFILTNSRSLIESEAIALAQQIAENLKAASEQTGQPVRLISRSDSTLRGHYPAETEPLKKVIYGAVEVLIPAFFEGGRVTVNDIHYVRDGSNFIPANQTPFAKDASFGYQETDLKKWVEEKTKGKAQAQDVFSLGLDLLRHKPVEDIAKILGILPEGQVCVVNALVPEDLEKATLAFALAEQAGKTFLYRTAASFVQMYAGIPKKPLLKREEVGLNAAKPGLLVVGSYVPKTTAQLQRLLQSGLPLQPIQVRVEQLLQEGHTAEVIEETLASIQKAFAENRHAVVFTSRQVIDQDKGTGQLDTGKKVSGCLVEVVRRLPTKPAFLVAKGGITSSDIATKALGVKRATVMGQVLPGVPVWRLGQETKFPQLPYIIFPGNVGDEFALVALLKGAEEKPT